MINDPNVGNDGVGRANRHAAPPVARCGNSMISERMRAELESMAVASGRGLLALQIGEGIEAIPFRGSPHVIVLDADADDFTTQFQPTSFPALFEAQDELVAAALRLTNEGVHRRQQKDLKAAFACYRFGLAVAVHFGVVRGITALGGNFWQLCESVRSRRRGTLARTRLTREELSAVEALRSALQRDCAGFASRVAALSESHAAAGNADESLELLVAAQRLRDVGRDPMRRTHFYALQQRATAIGRRDLVHLTLLEELAQSDLLETLTSATATPSSAGEDFAALWELYLRERADLHTVTSNDKLLQACFAALSTFENLRSRAVASGGAFGHRLSYALSTLVQVVGRDWCALVFASGDSAGACVAAERIRCRALCDWLARTHTTNRLRYGLNIDGGVGEVAPATVEEMAEAATTKATPLLMYFSTGRGYIVWLQKTDGTLLSKAIGDPSHLITRLQRLLPGFDVPDRAGEAGVVQRHFDPDDLASSDDERSQILRDLRAQLIPAEIENALRDQPPRLIIIPDSAVEYVPFCALEDDGGTFLVEERELVYWPSVTAGLILEGSERIMSLDGSRTQMPALVLGDPWFGPSAEVAGSDDSRLADLPPLDGARREAETIAQLFGVRAVLHEEAKGSLLFHSFGRGKAYRPLVHVAAHGVLDSAVPENSFLAMADGKLTLGGLLQFDPGVRCGLVMLSACQTSLGFSHPDSIISLATGFLIAGAHSVGATLWKIADEATVTLMTDFYRRVLAGSELGEALRASQLALLGEYRNPYFWAAFKLSGTAANPLTRSARPTRVKVT